MRRNYTYPRYAWITYNWYPDRWWTEAVTTTVNVNCTDDELERFLERVISLENYPVAEDANRTTDEGLRVNNCYSIIFDNLLLI